MRNFTPSGACPKCGRWMGRVKMAGHVAVCVGPKPMKSLKFLDERAVV